jgi:hypothetical protein
MQTKKFHTKRFPQIDRDIWVRNTQGFSNEKLFVQQCQNSDIKKVNSWPSESHLVIQVFASLPNILVPRPNAPLALSGNSELCLETPVNVFGRDALLAEKLNNDSLVVLYPLNEKPQTDGPRDNNSQRAAGVMPLWFSLSGCAIETISPGRW